MRGIPKYFNTKEDYINCLSLYPEETKSALRTLLNGRFMWQEAGVLASKEDGVEDDTHYVVERQKTCEHEEGEESTCENETEFVQMEQVVDKNSKFFALGFTVKEAEKLLAK